MHTVARHVDNDVRPADNSIEWQRSGRIGADLFQRRLRKVSRSTAPDISFAVPLAVINFTCVTP